MTVNAAPNTAPTVTITAPADGSTFTQGTSIAFTGTASDPEDGDIAASLAWTSSVDGAIGSGGSFSTSALSVGTHTITAAVTDSGGLPGSAAITMTVNALTSVVVGTVGYSTSGGRNQDRHLEVTVTIGPPVEGATVSATISLNGAPVVSDAGTTDALGQVTFKVTNAPSGTYTTTVTAVTGTGITWDPNSGTPPNSYVK